MLGYRGGTSGVYTGRLPGEQLHEKMVQCEAERDRYD